MVAFTQGRVRRIFALLVFGIFAVQTFGWGEFGHEAVADLAWAQAKAATRLRLAEIFKGAPEIFKARVGVEALEHAALWPDIIRSAYRDKDDPHDEDLVAFEPLGVTSASKADGFHYANFDKNKTLICVGNRCAVGAINRCLAVLKSGASSERQKAEALCYLVHCVGDLHQPLHAGFPTDFGGNSISVVKLAGKKKQQTLHGVWDSAMLKTLSFRTTALYVDDVLSPLVPSIKAEAMASLVPADWAAESHALAISAAYSDENGKRVKSNAELSQKYLDRGIAVTNRQIALAGLRLAALLDDAVAQ